MKVDMQNTTWVEGFLKRASSIGYHGEDAVELLKAAETLAAFSDPHFLEGFHKRAEEITVPTEVTWVDKLKKAFMSEINPSYTRNQFGDMGVKLQDAIDNDDVNSLATITAQLRAKQLANNTRRIATLGGAPQPARSIWG